MSGPTSLDSDASYILTEPVTQYAVVASDRHQRSSSVTPTIESTKPIRPFSWRKSHSVEKYEYRDVNLNSSIPEKINKSIPLPDDYWKIHEQDVKLWKIGCTTPNRPMSMRDLPKDSCDWEFNVQKYENLNGEHRTRIQYYTGDADTNRKHSLEGGERKEIKFPSLKAFKSASMRLPGQKSSLQEVHQMLRNKFNRLNVGLRKKRTLSVQEVFQSPTSQQKDSVKTPPTQFYVPSPAPSSKVYIDDTASTRSNGSNEVTSLPYFGNNGKPLNNQTSPTRNASPVKSFASQNGDAKKHMTRTESYRTKITVPAADDDGEGKKKPISPENGKPKFLVGGRVSLREKMPNKPSAATKISNAVRERIRRRPRSHSPVKPESKASNGRKNRDSVGFLDRINRIMSVNHLPPPHSGSPNNNNSTNNNMNRSKAIGSHESTAATTTTAAVAATTKKIQNDETKLNGASQSPVNEINNAATNHAKHQQTPETIFIRDRKITTKQVRKITTHHSLHLFYRRAVVV